MRDPCGWDTIRRSVRVQIFAVLLDESGTDDFECRRKTASGGKLWLLSGPWVMVWV